MSKLEELIWIGAIIIATVLTVKVSSWLIKRAFNRLAVRMKMDPTNYNFLKHTINVFVVAAWLLFLFNKIPELRHIGSAMLAGAAILTAAIGFAAQQSVANIISGIFIILFKPFRVGDSIVLPDDKQGTVEDITLRHTILRDSENKSIIVPNTTINSSTLVNATIAEQPVCALIEVLVSYTADIDRVMTVMREEIMTHPLLIDHRTEEQRRNEIPQVVIRVIELGIYAVKIRAWAWAANSSNAFVMKCDLLRKIKKRFDNEGISFPYLYKNVVDK